MDFTIFEARPGLAVLILPDAPKFTVVAVSNDYVKNVGIQREAFVGRGHLELFSKNPDHPGFTAMQNLKASYEHVIRHKDPHPLPLHRHEIPDGHGILSEKYWEALNVPVLNDIGEVAYIIHTALDMTDQVAVERRMESSKGMEKAYNFFMNAPVIIGYVKGKDYVIELANEGLLEVWGRTAEVIGKPLIKAIPELAAQGFIQLLDQVCTTGTPFYANEYPITLNRQGKDEVLYFDFVYKPHYENGTDNRAIGVISVGHEVTEQVKARRLLKESSQELALAIEIADLGTFRIDLLTNQATNSDKVTEWFGFKVQGYSLEEAFKPIHPEDRARINHLILATLQSEASSRHDVTYRVIHPATGALRHIRSFGKTLFNDNGKPYLITGILQDVTAQVLTQRQLERNEVELQNKVLERTLELENLNQELKRSNSNLEQFAYAASHDLKEPIRKINIFAGRLKQQLAKNLSNEQSDLFGRMEHAVRRMNMLIDDLLTYSHISKGASYLEKVDMNQKIKMVLEDLEMQVEEKKAKITVDRLPAINANKRQMQQLFQNLIGNALKYSKPGISPEIHISSKMILGGETPLFFKGEQANKPYHLIEIRDNGIGFEQENAEKIFSVFKRLHGNEVYQGTGVGLSIARKVVEGHNGHIWAESQPGEGASFKVLLPVE